MQLNRPLFFISFCYMTGIFASSLFPTNWLMLLLVIIPAVILYIIFFLKNKKADWAILSLFFILGMLYYAVYTGYFPGNHIKKYIEGNGNYINSVDVVVDEDPALSGNRLYFSAELISAFENGKKIENISGKVRVTLERKMGEDIEYGDVLHITGQLRAPEGIKNEGEFDYKKYLENRKIYYTIYAKQDNVIKTGRTIKNYFYYFSCKIKHRLIEIIYKSMPYEQAEIADGILLGNERTIPYDVYDKFNATGTVHILAVSGLKVGLVAAFIFLVLKLFRVKRKISAIITVVIITVFTVITGMPASAVRATIMSYAVLLCLAMERDSDIYTSLAVAAMAILLFKPVDLFDLGFQLSFLATFGIIYCNEYFMGFMKKLPVYIAEPLAITFTAQVFIVPALAGTFHMVSLVSVAANFLIVPITSLIIMLGLVMWFFGVFSLALAKIFGASLWLLVKAMMLAVDLLSSVPYAAISMKSFSAAFVILYFVFFLVLPNNDIDMKIKKISLKAVLGIILLLSAVMHIFYAGSGLRFYGLDTRGLNAGFVKTTDNKKILILCGSEKSRAGAGLYGVRNTIIPFLKSEGINNIDYLVLLSAVPDTEYINRNFRVYRTIYGHGIMLEKPGNDTIIEVNTNGVNINCGGKNIVFSRYFERGARYEQNSVMYICSSPQDAKIELAGDSVYMLNSANLQNYKPIHGSNIIDLLKTGMAKVTIKGQNEKDVAYPYREKSSY